MKIILAVPLTLSPIGTTDIFYFTYNYFRYGNIFYSHHYFKITVVIKSTTRSWYSVRRTNITLSHNWLINVFQSNQLCQLMHFILCI